MTINATVYYQTLEKLKRAILNHRRDLLSSGIVLLHNNAQPHNTAVTHVTLQKFKRNVYHPLHGPELASCDFHLVMHLKNGLSAHRFINNAELKSAVEGWLQKNRWLTSLRMV